MHVHLLSPSRTVILNPACVLVTRGALKEYLYLRPAFRISYVIIYGEVQT